MGKMKESWYVGFFAGDTENGYIKACSDNEAVAWFKQEATDEGWELLEVHQCNDDECLTPKREVSLLTAERRTEVMLKWYEESELERREALCFECETKDCALNNDGLCCFPMVHGEVPTITEVDGCTDMAVC